jgi:hypothetical protein
MIAKPPKKRTINLGDVKVMQETNTLSADVYAFGLNDIHDMIVSITTRDVGVEIREGNDPTTIEVDGSKNKTLQSVEKKAIVLFSKGITVAALNELRGVLIANIKATTDSITGQLADAANWEFRLIRQGRRVSLPESGTVLLQQRDYIVLMPRLSYASAVNKRVASGSKSLTYRPSNAKATSKIGKRNQKLGFMAMTARQARGMKEFATFSVTVWNTKAFAVPGERRRFGTAFLRISPRRLTARR